MVQKNLKLVALAVLMGTVSTGCSLVGEHKMTGGGTIDSAGGDKKAVFTFNAERCDGENAKGNVIYRDESAIDFEDMGGVALKAKLDDFGYCTIPGLEEQAENGIACHCEDQYEAQFTYTSNNPEAPGEGVGFACFFDTGEGNGRFNGVVTAMNLVDGPYAGYINHGTMNGNIQSHSCPAKTEDSE
ncbi:hypothetical protein [Thalassotalea mangrovi]|uniref:Lipoprotein n=1 Tax=Thalassotalea mangrovi TaxID=2572245 RepID=A0A4U1BAM9_9GAMM|nr:hypothetical protein [Thalassotalea mangrovi]TKB47837.1 hypothetical protein E8M12_00060 [Thalassotalea mangrovi]